MMFLAEVGNPSLQRPGTDPTLVYWPALEGLCLRDCAFETLHLTLQPQGLKTLGPGLEDKLWSKAQYEAKMSTLLKAVASSVQAVRDKVTVNLQTPGAEYVPLPMHRGLLGLGRNIVFPQKAEKDEVTTILLVAVHGLVNSTSLETSNEMLIRARGQFLSVFPDLTIYERSIGSDGKIKERVEHCFDTISQETALLRRVDMVFFIAHSQGCVVSMLTLARLLDAKKLDNKQFGLIAFAGIHQGTIESYASISSAREATHELYLMSDPFHELSQTYRTAVATVVGCGGRVIAFHSYDDNVVSCISSTLFGILPSHKNLAVGLYIPHYLVDRWHNGDLIDDCRPDLMMKLVALWLKARNCGHKWDSRWENVLRETTSYSEGLSNAVSNAVESYLNTLDISININVAHCELYTSSLLYLYGAYWMLQPTSQVATAIPTITATQLPDWGEVDLGAPATPALQLEDFVVTELQAARDFLGDLIADDVTKWLDAFAEFNRSKSVMYKEFKSHWKRMQSGWNMRV